MVFIKRFFKYTPKPKIQIDEQVSSQSNVNIISQEQLLFSLAAELNTSQYSCIIVELKHHFLFPRELFISIPTNDTQQPIKQWSNPYQNQRNLRNVIALCRKGSFLPWADHKSFTIESKLRVRSIHTKLTKKWNPKNVQVKRRFELSACWVSDIFLKSRLRCHLSWIWWWLGMTFQWDPPPTLPCDNNLMVDDILCTIARTYFVVQPLDDINTHTGTQCAGEIDFPTNCVNRIL